MLNNATYMSDTHILLIEDDQFLRDMYAELLADEGYLVDTSGDGYDGFIKLQHGAYSLVLLDIMLPKMDGLQILRRARDNNLLAKHGPIVLLSNLGQDDIVKQGFELGAAGYLIKSALTPDQVLHEIRIFLHRS